MDKTGRKNMKMKRNWVKFIILAIILVAIAGAVAYTPKLVHLTLIKFNPSENKVEEVIEENVEVAIEIKPNKSIEVHPESGEVTIVGEAFPEEFSGCIEKDKAKEMALDILLNDEEARKILLELIEGYGNLVVEFYERQGIFESNNGEYVEKVCTGELVIYPKNFFSMNITISTEVDFVNRKLYLAPVLCDKVSGDLCIRYIDPELRKPTDTEREYAEEVLKEMGYEEYRTSIAVKQLYTMLPNGTLVPSSVMYWIILEPETSKGIFRAILLNFNSDRVEDIDVKEVFIISAIPSQSGFKELKVQKSVTIPKHGKSIGPVGRIVQDKEITKTEYPSMLSSKTLSQYTI